MESFKLQNIKEKAQTFIKPLIATLILGTSIDAAAQNTEHPQNKETIHSHIPAENFKNNVEKNMYYLDSTLFTTLHEKGKLPESVHVSCIDGRRGGLPGEKTICIPGAEGGILLDALDYGEKLCIEEEKIITIVKSILGNELNVHSDTHHEGGVSYSGCGHIMGELKNDTYGVDSNARKFFESQPDSIYSKEIYSGSHDEAGVTIIKRTDASIPSINEGIQTFVYSEKWHEEILKQIADKIALESNIDKTLAETELLKIAKKHIAVTIENLAKGLPVVIIE